MIINPDKSGVITGIGMNKLKIVVDGATRGDVESTKAKELAQKEASVRGFGGGGMCETPQTGPVGPSGDILDGEDALNPNIEIHGYRTEFVFAQRA